MQRQSRKEAIAENNKPISNVCVRRPRVHRKQSLRRLNYKKSSAARSDDIPGLPSTEEFFKSEDRPKILDNSFVNEELEPYIDSETGVLPQPPSKDSSNSSSSSNSTVKAATPAKQKSKNLQQKTKQGRSKSVSPIPHNDDENIVVSTVTLVSAKATPQPIQPREELFEGILKEKRSKNRSASPALGKYNKIRRQLKVAVLNRDEGQQSSKKAPSRESTGSSSEADDEDDDEEGVYSSISSMSTEANAGGNDEDGFDCCVQLWNIMVKIVRLMFEAGNYVLDHKLLFYPLALIFLYLCLGVLHSIFASILASFAGWVWPPLHFILSTTAGFVWRLADWLSWVDELGRSLICDMAASYCRRYRLLCDRQCSFVDRAVVSHGHRIF